MTLHISEASPHQVEADAVVIGVTGESFNESPPHGYTPKGGTGAATRTLVQLAQDMADGRL